jgi:hypothetical protein
LEIYDLQEKVLRVEQQLSAKVDISPEKETDCAQQETIDLKSKLQSKVLLLIMFFHFVYLSPLCSIPVQFDILVSIEYLRFGYILSVILLDRNSMHVH